MKSEQDVNLDTPEQDQIGKTVESENIMKQGLSAVKKPGKGLIVGMILCIVLAVGGVSFGIWAMMDGSRQNEEYEYRIHQLEKQKEQYDDRVSSLVEKNSELETRIQLLKQGINKETNKEDFEPKTGRQTWPIDVSQVENEVRFTNNSGEVIWREIDIVRIKKCDTDEEKQIVWCAVEVIGDDEEDDKGIIYYGNNGKVDHWSASGAW